MCNKVCNREQMDQHLEQSQHTKRKLHTENRTRGNCMQWTLMNYERTLLYTPSARWGCFHSIARCGFDVGHVRIKYYLESLSFLALSERWAFHLMMPMWLIFVAYDVSWWWRVCRLFNLFVLWTVRHPHGMANASCVFYAKVFITNSDSVLVSRWHIGFWCAILFVIGRSSTLCERFAPVVFI